MRTHFRSFCGLLHYTAVASRKSRNYFNILLTSVKNGFDYAPFWDASTKTDSTNGYVQENQSSHPVLNNFQFIGYIMNLLI